MCVASNTCLIEVVLKYQMLRVKCASNKCLITVVFKYQMLRVKYMPHRGSSQISDAASQMCVKQRARHQDNLLLCRFSSPPRPMPTPCPYYFLHIRFDEISKICQMSFFVVGKSTVFWRHIVISSQAIYLPASELLTILRLLNLTKQFLRTDMSHRFMILTTNALFNRHLNLKIGRSKLILMAIQQFDTLQFKILMIVDTSDLNHANSTAQQKKQIQQLQW